MYILLSLFRKGTLKQLDMKCSWSNTVLQLQHFVKLYGNIIE